MAAAPARPPRKLLALCPPPSACTSSPSPHQDSILTYDLSLSQQRWTSHTYLPERHNLPLATSTCCLRALSPVAPNNKSPPPLPPYCPTGPSISQTHPQPSEHGHAKTLLRTSVQRPYSVSKPISSNAAFLPRRLLAVSFPVQHAQSASSASSTPDAPTIPFASNTLPSERTKPASRRQ